MPPRRGKDDGAVCSNRRRLWMRVRIGNQGFKFGGRLGRRFRLGLAFDGGLAHGSSFRSGSDHRGRFVNQVRFLDRL